MSDYQILCEFLTNQENPSIKKERLSRQFTYLYHGTPINLLNKIKKEGLKISYMRKYLDSPMDKNALFFTSSLKYSIWYSKAKMPLFKRSKWVVLKCKLNTKYLRFILGPSIINKSDEYIYYKDVPANDIEIITN